MNLLNPLPLRALYLDGYTAPATAVGRGEMVVERGDELPRAGWSHIFARSRTTLLLPRPGAQKEPLNQRDWRGYEFHEGLLSHADPQKRTHVQVYLLKNPMSTATLIVARLLGVGT